MSEESWGDELRIRTKGHPEAFGRIPKAGEHAYTLKFPMDTGGDLLVECGEEDLTRFSEMIGSMLLDNAAEVKTHG